MRVTEHTFKRAQRMVKKAFKMHIPAEEVWRRVKIGQPGEIAGLYGLPVSPFMDAESIRVMVEAHVKQIFPAYFLGYINDDMVVYYE